MSGETIEEGSQLQACQEQLDISFSQLSYHVPLNRGKTKKPILRSLSGVFHHGKLTAILGPSGAGKTSMLNILSGFRTKGVSGSVMVNGFPRDVKEFRKYSCYITQDIAMLPNLTASETLLFIASLRLGRSISNTEKLERVTLTLDLLGLQNAANTLVSKLSGGEKKRLSIAIELIRNPPVMFLDEPTSGLDSSSALLIISHLKKLAESGRTIVCSIHQPSSRIFGIFDDIYLLSEGQCLYRGEVSTMTTALDTAGFSCPTFYNPADFAIEIAYGERGSNESLAAQYNSNELVVPGNGNHDTAPMLATKVDEVLDSAPLPKAEKIRLEMWYHFIILFRRSLLCTFRDLFMMKLRLAINIVVGLFLGIVYYNFGNEASMILSNMAFLFFLIFFTFFVNSLSTVLSYPTEAAVLVREYHNNCYSIAPYLFSKLVADLPLQLACPTAFLSIGYYLTNQPTDVFRFFQFWIICFLLTIHGQSFGLALGAIFDEQIGMFLVPSMSIPMLLFSGYFLNLRDMSVRLKWLSNVSYFRHSFEAVMVTTYGYNRPDMHCSLPYCHYKSPKKLLKEFAMDNASYSFDVLQLVIWIILLQCMYFGALKWRLRVAR